MILAFHFFDIIRVPFGYLMDILYQLTSNYGLALILFSLLVKLILMPVSAKSKKSMMQMSRLAPLTKIIQDKYPNDVQKAQLEISKLYKEEGVSMMGGCLWSLVPLLIIFPLFYIIREPLVYMLHLSGSQASQIVSIIKEHAPELFRGNSYYDQLAAAPHLAQFASQIREAIPELANTSLPSLNFQFVGINLAQVPDWKIWSWSAYSWDAIGAFLLPVVSAASQVATMWLGQKMNASVSTDKDGNLDESAAKANSTSKTMMWLMPIITLVFGFSYPCSLSLYWIAQGTFGVVQDAILTKHYRKLYDAEDDIKRRVAAERAAAEAERERIRAKRRAENPDGIMENTSKKKLQKQQQSLKEKNQAAFKKAEEDAPLSGDPERPFAKGRAYRADRYSRNGSSVEQSEE